MAFGSDAATAAALARGCAGAAALTVAFERIGAEWELAPAVADPFVRQELTETAYHVLWELVHVFFEHRGLLAGRDAARMHDAGASSFLYPFLAEGEHDAGARAGRRARARCRLKAEETALLRAQTLGGWPRHADRGGDASCASGSTPAARCSRSATGARRPMRWTWSPTCAHRPASCPARRAIDLTEDAAILTAIANDIGIEAIFRAPGDRLRPRRATRCSRSRRAVDSAQHHRGARRGARDAGSRRSRWSATTAAGSPRSVSPTMCS